MNARHGLRRCMVAAMLAAVLTVTGGELSAQSGATAPSGIRLSSEDVVSAVRISILNGIIDYVNQAKHARLGVEWELLPVGAPLQQDAASQLVIPQTVNLANAGLQAERWPRAFPAPLVEAISHDLGTPLDAARVSQADIDRWHEKFLADWLGDAKGALARRALVPRAYYALLRDHNFLYFLLRGNGIGLYIDAQSQQPVLGLPKVAGDGITWVIRQYPFLVDRGQGILVYRYGISARLAPFDIYFSNLAQDQVTLSAQVGIRPSDISVGLFSRLAALDNFEVKLEPARQERLEKIEAGGALQRVNAVLDLVGAPELGALVARGLFGGSRTSLVSGVLASRNEVGGFLGANTDLGQTGRDWRAGLLFGLDPRQADVLYAGPSLRNQALLLSVGARLASAEKAPTTDSGRTVRGELGGVLSIDLGQLFGAPHEITQLRLAQAQVGGNWAISSDLLGQDLGYLEISYADLAAPAFDAVQVSDARDQPVDPKLAQVIRCAPQPSVRRLFVPAGYYQLMIPAGRVLVDHGFPVAPSRHQVGAQVLEGYFLTVPWETAAEVNYDLR